METSADRLMGALEEQKKLDKLSKRQKYILDIIKAHPGCENSDIRLLEAVWEHEGWETGKSLYWNLSRVTSSEAITRTRRLLHEKGYITYTKEVEQKRYDQFITMRNEHGEEITVIG
jgi:hypothetical protein